MVGGAAGARVAGPFPLPIADWTARGRVAGATALRSTLVLAHAAVTASLNAVLTALCAGSRDEEAEVRRLLREAARLLGACVAPEAQLGVLLPQLRGEVSGLNNAQHYTAALEVSQAAPASHAPPPIPQLPSPAQVISSAILSMRPEALEALLPTIAAALASDHLAEDGSPALRAALSRAVAATIDAAVVARPGAGSAAVARDVEQRRLHQAGAAGQARRLLRSFSYGGGGLLADTVPRGSEWLDDSTLDALLIALLACCEHGAPEEGVAGAVEAAHSLAAALGYGRSAHLLAAAAHRLVPRICAGAAGWTAHALGRRLFDTLLRLGRASLSGRSAPEAAALVRAVVDAFVASLAPDSDPALRIAQLALCDSFILGPEEEEAGGASGSGGGHAAHLRRRGGPHASSTEPLEPGRVPSAVSARMDVVPTLLASAVATVDVEVSAARCSRSPGPIAHPPPSRLVQRAALAGGGAHTVSDVTVDEALRAVSGVLLSRALLPNAVWRVGLVPSTIRKVSVACAASLVQVRDRRWDGGG